MTSFPDHPFWDFSLRVYGSEGVAPACLVLQEAHGIDVNVLLLCCWLGASGRGAVGQDGIGGIVETVSAWHGEIVRGLRAVRKRLKEPVGGEDRDLALSIRKQVQKIEIDAEHIEQLTLAADTAAPGGPAPGKAGSDAAAANAAAYFSLLCADLNVDDHADVDLLLATAAATT
jgi:uncharacterized protein (TIGR02444 family)